MLRVLALVPYPTGRVPGQRYRIEQWAPHLRRLGVDVTLAPGLSPAAYERLQRPGGLAAKAAGLLAAHARRRRELRKLGGFDVAYVYRETVPGRSDWCERQLAARLPFVLDFDDAIYLPAVSPANAAFAWLKDPDKAARLCRMARRVMVGNDTLAAWAASRSTAVDVVPSTIDTDVYVPAPRDTAGAGRLPVIGWTGSATTVPYLEALGPVLERVRQQRAFELRVIGGQPRLAPALAARVVPWRAETEVADLQSLDIGLMPLSDDAWSRGKCGMKALQYMALAVPPVVSPVGVNATIVRHGENGLHGTTEDQWVAALVRLLDDPPLRARLGAEARRTVEARYSARVLVPRVAAILREAAR